MPSLRKSNWLDNDQSISVNNNMLQRALASGSEYRLQETSAINMYRDFRGK
jgi:hypothetical protein